MSLQEQHDQLIQYLKEGKFAEAIEDFYTEQVIAREMGGEPSQGRAEIAANECDLMLAVGSTLSVYPIANVVPIAASHGAPVVIVNGDATQFDAIAEVVINGGISETLPYLCRADVG